MSRQSPTRCGDCGGSLERKTIVHTQPWGEDLYRFEDVPALVCAQCGSVWLEAQVSQAIDRVIQSHTSPKRFQSVPVFSLAEVITSP